MRAFVGALGILGALAAWAAAQEWPAKQFNFIVPFAAGGTTDLFGRLLAQHMQKNFDKPFIVENKPGAGGNIGAGQVAKAAPDGYPFLGGTVSTHAINPFLYSKLPYDTVKDFQPVSLIARLPNILVVHPSLPANNVAELIAHLKANPDKLSYDRGKVSQPVSLIARLPNILVVHPSLPANNVAELIAHLKANPDKLSYGSSGAGAALPLAAEL